MMVMMALLTTMMTSPALSMIERMQTGYIKPVPE